MILLLFYKEMKKIKLTQGKFAIINNEDFDRVSQFNWQYDGGENGYAKRSIRIGLRKENRKWKEYLHRYITGCPQEFCVDHINGDKLDCRRNNLRICNMSQNLGNSNINKLNTSGFKGVTWLNKNKKWMAQINFKNKHFYLGSFTNRLEAGKTYNVAATRFFGNYSKLNNI